MRRLLLLCGLLGVITLAITTRRAVLRAEAEAELWDEAFESEARQPGAGTRGYRDETGGIPVV